MRPNTPVNWTSVSGALSVRFTSRAPVIYVGRGLDVRLSFRAFPARSHRIGMDRGFPVRTYQRLIQEFFVQCSGSRVVSPPHKLLEQIVVFGLKAFVLRFKAGNALQGMLEFGRFLLYFLAATPSERFLTAGKRLLDSDMVVEGLPSVVGAQAKADLLNERLPSELAGLAVQDLHNLLDDMVVETLGA